MGSHILNRKISCKKLGHYTMVTPNYAYSLNRSDQVWFDLITFQKRKKKKFGMILHRIGGCHGRVKSHLPTTKEILNSKFKLDVWGSHLLPFPSLLFPSSPLSLSLSLSNIHLSRHLLLKPTPSPTCLTYLPNSPFSIFFSNSLQQ